jgi:hypothetical protein
VGDPFQQVHDWEPGILASGLFWTIPISPSSIIVNQNTGAATLRVSNLAVPDYGNFFNAISPTPDPPPVPSHVSFEVTWPGRGAVTEIDDDVFDFSGRFVVSDATISFTARNDNAGVIYRSNPDGQISFDAGVGSERNGIFH